MRLAISTVVLGMALLLHSGAVWAQCPPTTIPNGDLPSRELQPQERPIGRPAEGFNAYAMQEYEDRLFVVTANGNASRIHEIRPMTEDLDSFAIESIERINGLPIPGIERMTLQNGRLHLFGDSLQFELRPHGWVRSLNPEPDLYHWNSRGALVGVDFVSQFWVPLARVDDHIVDGPDGTRFLVWNSEITSHADGGAAGSGIYALSTDTAAFYALPQPSFELFARLRPERVENGYTVEFAEIEVEIGPFQRVGRCLWFGMSFYDGEGLSGVGGVGVFDLEARAYRTLYGTPARATDFSASALYVDDEFVWIGLEGLYEFQEGGSYEAGFGLTRYRIADGAVKRWQVPHVINLIREFRGALFLATSGGVFVLEGDRLEGVMTAAP